MKKTKKIISVVLVIAFTLSLGYFATLTPTGAWLYDSAKEEVNYEFGNFDVATGQFIMNEELVFEASTKFNDYIGASSDKKASDDAAADFDAANDFEDDTKDKVVFKRDITVENSGNVPARIYVSVDGGILENNSSAGENEFNVSYFFYLVEDGETSIRDAMESNLVSFNSDTALTTATRMSTLESYQDEYITLDAPQEGEESVTKTLRVMFWADHDIVGDTLDNTEVVQTLNTDVRIILTAIQNTDGAIDSYYEANGITTSAPVVEG